MRNHVAAVVCGIALLAPSLANAAWYDSNWLYRKKITIDSAQVTGTLTDFPVLISFASDSDLAADARPDGFDLLFTDDDGTTQLDHEVERYVSGSGALVAWVRIPNLPSAVDKEIFLYYGYPTSPDQQNKTAVWTSGFAAVWHLNDDFLDATSFNNDGTNNGSADIAGRIADGQDFDGVDDYIDLSLMNPRGYDDFTLSAWYKSTDTSASDDEYVYMHIEGVLNELTFGPTDDVADQLRFGLNRGGAWDPHYGTSDIVDQQWHHLAAVRGGGRVKLYVDGVEETDGVDAHAGLTVNINGSGPFIGDYPGNTEQVHGVLDEVRFSTAIRSLEWIQTSHNNQSDPSSFYTLGAQQPSFAYDSISYPSGNLGGNNGGIGWAGAWDAGGSIQVVAGGLTHPGGGLLTAGDTTELNALPFHVPALLGRDLDGSLGEVTETLWASFLLKPQETVDPDFSYMGLAFGTGGVGNTDQVFVGYSGTNFKLNNWGGGGVNIDVPGVIADQTFFLVLELNISESGNETARLYVDPTAGLASPDVAASLPKSDLDLGTFGTVSIGGGRDGATNLAQLDEIRVGYSYAEVAPAAPSNSISGRVFEDADFAGTATNWDGGANDLGLDNVDVELYDGTDTYVTSVTTSAGGTYSFPGLADDTYKVRVRSATVGDADTPPAGTLNASVPATWPYPLAEMTWANTAALYGGQDPTVDDTATGDNAGPGDTYVSVTVSGADVTGVNLGLAYNLIVNTADDGLADNTRSAQGSFRQFVKNANAIDEAGGTTASTSEFRIPTTDPGYNAGTGVFTITPSADLPVVADGATTLDGSTQTANIGNTNTVVLGAGGTVGVDDVPLGTVAGPEVEIRDVGALTIAVHGQADSLTVRGLAIYGFGGAQGEGAITIADGVNATLIEDNVLGSSASTFTEPGAGSRNWDTIYSDGADGGTIRNNLIGFGEYRGIFLLNTSTDWTIQGNEIRDCGMLDATGDGVALDESSTCTGTGNLVTGASSQGIVLSSGGSTFTNNTVTGNGVGLLSGVSQSNAIAIRSGVLSATFDRNVIEDNYGAGIAVNDGASGITITRDRIFGNGTIIARDSSPPTGQVGIDLNSATDDNNLGTPPYYTVNDGGDGDSGGNGLLNFPVITSATESGGTVSVDFDLDLGAPLAGDYRIEFFTNPSGPDPSGYGEGEAFAGTVNINHTGSGVESFSHSFAGAAGDTLTATTSECTDPGCMTFGSTSEFSARVGVVAARTISGRVFEDADFAGTATDWDGGTNDLGLDNVDVELYDGTDTYVTSVTTAAGGAFSFPGLADDTYKVRVRSATVGDADTPPKGTLNASVPATWPYPLPEMTWGNGVALYGGQSAADDSDTGDNAGPGDAYVSVAVSGADVTGVNLGLAYNLIVNALDDGLADNTRSDQGSFRQFLKNANAIGAAGGTTANTSEFRVPGGGPYTIQPTSALPAISDSVIIDGYTQPGAVANTIPALGALDGTLQIVIDGTIVGGTIDGLVVNAAGTTIRGLVVRSFTNTGIRTNAANTIIAGNYIGTDVTGSLPRGNTRFGIDVRASSVQIGGPNPEDRNLISGNVDVAVNFWSAAAAGGRVEGNLIGTDATGLSDVPNIDDGIHMAGGAGTATIVDNVVSGNDEDGMEFADASGSNVVQGNYIGVDITGAAALPNARYGLVLYNGVFGNQIGGTGVGESNVISGNSNNGVVIDGNGGAATINNVLEGNYIGTNAAGDATIPNLGHGIRLHSGARDNTIGGTAGGAGNTIAYNVGDGITLNDASTDDNVFSGNSIFENGGLGIELAPGANNDKAPPVIVSANPNGPNFRVVATVGATDTVEFFRVDNAAAPLVVTDGSGAGEGYLYLGRCVDGGTASGPHLSGVLDADPAAGQLEVTVLASGMGAANSLTATATDATDGTSPFGANASVTSDADLSLTMSIDDATPNVGTNVVFTLTVSNAGPSGATGVSVTDLLPAGFTYVSDDGGGSYVSGTGVWTVGAIAASGGNSLDITAKVNAAGPYANSAEVTTANEPDPDSTPGNDLPAEDDQDSVTPVPRQLEITKRAFLEDGTPIANASTLPAGTRVRFLLYVNNPGSSVADVSVRDVLDPTFQYVTNTLRYDAAVGNCAGPTCTPTEEDAIFAAANAGTVGTDVVDGDVVSFGATTVDAGDELSANAPLAVPAGKVWALVFTVKMD